VAAARRDNNFDLLRLFAAFQVVYFHSAGHLDPGAAEIPWLDATLRLFPGVPIFFVISGYLVSLAYERSPSLGSYARNRFLRLYPGLWGCFAVSLALIGAFGQIDREFLASCSFFLWVGAQLTVLQTWNPDALRDFGVGVLNGSLWTIPVELSFYVAVPLLYRFVMRGPLRRLETSLLVALAVASYALWFASVSVGGRTGGLWVKLASFTLPAHLHMFLIGLLLQRSSGRVARWVEGRVLAWTALYLGLSWAVRIGVGGPERAAGALLPVSAAAWALMRICLAFWILAAAFTARGAAHATLRGHDISYGVYLYHALVINLCAALGFGGRGAVIAVMGAAALLGTLSWFLVERPALRRKRSSIHPQDPIAHAGAP
jgi:peptidoglycan/LPS O-acetylase OafA/YrhL